MKVYGRNMTAFAEWSGDSGMMTGSVIQFDQSVWGGYDGQAPGPAEALTG